MFAIVHAGCRQIVVSCIREHCASEEALYKDPQVYPTSVHVVLGASVREARERVSGKQQTGSMQDAAYEFRRTPLPRTRVNSVGWSQGVLRACLVRVRVKPFGGF